MRRTAVALGTSLALAGSAAGTCPTDAGPASMNRKMDAAEVAYGQMDATTFSRLIEGVVEELPCLDDPIEPPLAARVHRMQGLRAYLDGQADAARLAFAASRALDGEYRFPEAMVPLGTQERLEYKAVPLDVDKRDHSPVPKHGAVYFDGTESLERPSTWPTLFQYAEDGVVLHTTYLWPESPLPAYDARKTRDTNLPAIATGVSAGIGAVGLGMWGYAWYAQGRWCQEGTEHLSFCQDTVEPLGRVGGTVAIVGGVGAVGGGVWWLVSREQTAAGLRVAW